MPACLQSQLLCLWNFYQNKETNRVEIHSASKAKGRRRYAKTMALPLVGRLLVGLTAGLHCRLAFGGRPWRRQQHDPHTSLLFINLICIYHLLVQHIQSRMGEYSMMQQVCGW
jgi:hypothetical protein